MAPPRPLPAQAKWGTCVLTPLPGWCQRKSDEEKGLLYLPPLPVKTTTTLISLQITHFSGLGRGIFFSFSFPGPYTCVCRGEEVFSEAHIGIFGFGLKLRSAKPLKFTPPYPFDFAPNPNLVFWASGTLVNLSGPGSEWAGLFSSV